MTAIKVRQGGVWVDSSKTAKARIGGAWVDFGPAAAGDQYIFNGETPTNIAEDGVALAQGTKFRSSVAGIVKGARWYFGVSPPTVAKGALYRVSDLALLASATFGAPDDVAWNNVLYSAPVAIAANTDYMAVCWTSNRYPYTPSYSYPHTSGDLTASASFFKVAADIAFPDTGSSLNFNCDVIFSRS